MAKLRAKLQREAQSQICEREEIHLEHAVPASEADTHCVSLIRLVPREDQDS
jgi:hypothetical protein